MKDSTGQPLAIGDPVTIRAHIHEYRGEDRALVQLLDGTYLAIVTSNTDAQIDPVALRLRSGSGPVYNNDEMLDVIVGYCNDLRASSLALEQQLRALKGYVAKYSPTASMRALNTEQFSEAMAHATLAFRQQELVRFHVGKVIQYHEGGVSIYDKQPQAPAPEPERVTPPPVAWDKDAEIAAEERRSVPPAERETEEP